VKPHHSTLYRLNSLVRQVTDRFDALGGEPEVARAGASPDGGLGLSLRKPAVLGLVATLSIAIGGLLGGQTYETHLPGAWFFGMPGGHLGSIGSSGAYPPIAAAIAVFGGLILLTRVWLGLLRQLSRHRGIPVKRIVGVVLIWAIPLLLAPPLFSRDVYSYAGQGEMVSHHINPYDYGTGVLGSTPFSTLPDAVWTNTPSPYGPTFLSVDGILNDVSGHGFLADLLLLRLLEVASLALVVCALPSLARAAGRDPAQAVLLGVGCPLVLTTLLSGAHNDAMMVGLLVAGLAVARRFGTIPGVVLCALAAGVKSPAALGVLFLGWAWAGPGATLSRRIAHTAGAGVIGLVTLQVVSMLSGTGWGWLRNAAAADKSFTIVTPIDAISRFVADVASVVNLHVSELGARTVFGATGLACAGAIGVWLLTRSPSEGLVRNVGLSLLVVALLGPILWAWYVTWGIMVLAAVASGRLRSAVIVICTFEVFVGVATLHTDVQTLVHAGLLASLVLAAVLLATAIVPLGRAEPTSDLDTLPLMEADRQLIGAVT
jgi:alpha-1,6-mannosyltransferase